MLQRSRKLHFNGLADVIKFSTVHSYKGWESDTIVELVEPNSQDEEKDTVCELIYTGFTRAKRNLFVINCGNMTYEQELCSIFNNRN
jgi:superfamily I DNA/RNA helicase